MGAKYVKLALAAATVVPAVTALGKIYGDTPDAKHAWAVHDWNRPKPVKVEPAARCGGAPSDAVVLFDGSRESFERNWCDKKGEPSRWKLGTEGDFYCEPGWKSGSIFTRAKFGDCQLHLEYRHDADIGDLGKGPQMRGNSGVFLMNQYELQVLESYYTHRDGAKSDKYVDNYADGVAGSVYAENPPLVNPQRKPGEWQTYDIVFHQPVWDGDKLLHPGSVTLFFNGVLVQDHWEMEGLTTHCKRRPLAPHDRVGPLSFQDHGCAVHFRNVWYRPLPSRWDNKTHSSLSADPDEVMKLRRETAATLFAKISDPKKADVATLLALGEVISYANEAPYRDAFDACLAACRTTLDDKAKAAANKGLDVLVRNKVTPASVLFEVKASAKKTVKK